MANKEAARKKLDDFMKKFDQPNLSRGSTLSRASTYVDVYGNPIPDYKTPEEKKAMTEDEETALLQEEMDLAERVDTSDWDISSLYGDGKEDHIVSREIGKIGGGKKKRRRIRKKKQTKKKAPKKRHRKSKKARKSKKKNSWCKSSKSWCKYTKKNNCKKGLWSKKTKLGRASRKWCKVTKRWCKVNDKTCKKRR